MTGGKRKTPGRSQTKSTPKRILGVKPSKSGGQEVDLTSESGAKSHKRRKTENKVASKTTARRKGGSKAGVLPSKNSNSVSSDDDKPLAHSHRSGNKPGPSPTASPAAMGSAKQGLPVPASKQKALKVEPALRKKRELVASDIKLPSAGLAPPKHELSHHPSPKSSPVNPQVLSLTSAVSVPNIDVSDYF